MPRPQLQIDEDTVRLLASVGCTVQEIADHVGCSKRTLERRFATAIKRGRATLAVSLRRKQVELALRGNVAMLIFLGKVYMAQHETVQVEHTGLPARGEEVDYEAILAAAKEIEKRGTTHPNTHAGRNGS